MGIHTSNAKVSLSLLEIAQITQDLKDRLKQENTRGTMLSPAEEHQQLVRARAIRILSAAYDDHKHGEDLERDSEFLGTVKL